MPSEIPKMPGETYEHLLRRGGSHGLGLMANEVAWVKSRPSRLISYDAKILASGTLIGIIITLVGFVFILNR